MKFNFKAKVLAAMVIVLGTGAFAASNYWEAHGNSGASGADAILWSIPISTHFVPGSNNAQDLGTSALNVRDGWFGRTLNTVGLSATGLSTQANVYAAQLGFTRSAAVTTNQVLTAASPTYLGLGNMTANVTLPDATTETAGRIRILKVEISTAGNVGVFPSGTQTIDGGSAGANVNITTKGTLRLTTDGANWFSW